MAPNHTFRPENVLRRAEGLIAVGQSDAALQALYDFITAKRTRSIPPTDLEPIVQLFVSLAVDAKSGKLVKDGLHQYKKIAQYSDSGLASLERVVKKFLQLSASKLEEAQSQANVAAEAAAEASAVAAAAAQKVIETLDEDEEYGDDKLFSISPEDILLSAVSTDDSTDRSNKEFFVPWLKFMWEAYRTVLDLLRNNSKLEVGYCYVINQTFQFCLKFDRRTEFRRLCEMLRNHLESFAQKPTDSPVDYVNLSNPDTLQRFLDTRFIQLNTAVKLELWQESFRSVEDVHTLMTISKRQPKPNAMINYFENLAKIFSVSDNYLFTASARQRFFNLFVQSPIATEDELKHYASLQLISALSVPTSTNAIVDEFVKRKNNRLASLLNLNQSPSRTSLLKQASISSVFKYADPALIDLYNLLETNFRSLSFSKISEPILSAIKNNPDYKFFIKPLQNVILNKIFNQISEVYQTIKFEFLIKLCTFKDEFYLSPLEIEHALLQASNDGWISVEIDDEAKVISFNSNPFDESLEFSSCSNIKLSTESKDFDVKSLQLSPAELVRYQLSNLAKTLSESVKLINIEQTKAYDDELLSKSLSVANDEFETEKKSILSRFDQLKKRKAEVIELKRTDEEIAAKAKIERLATQKRLEQERAEAEVQRRAEEKLRKEREAVQLAEKKKIIDEVNSKGIIKIDEEEVKNLDADKLHQMQLEKLEKDKKELEEKTNALAKRADYLERAQRKYELPLLAKDADEQKVKEVEIYNEMKNKLIQHAQKEHEEAVKLRDRLKRVVPDYEELVKDAKAEQIELFKKQKEIAKAKFEEAKQDRINQFIAMKKSEWEAEQEAKQKQLAEETQKAKLLEERAKLAEERIRLAEERKLAADPDRRLYNELKSKDPSTLKFAEKQKLKRLIAKYE